MSKIVIYHNPRCSKSRQTLALLEDQGIKPQVVEYLTNPPSKTMLKKIVKMLDCQPRDIIRRNEEEYKSLNLNDTSLNQDVLITAMVTHPKLIERPIVVNGDRAAIGRPPENVLEIL